MTNEAKGSGSEKAVVVSADPTVSSDNEPLTRAAGMDELNSQLDSGWTVRAVHPLGEKALLVILAAPSAV
jgi:hypothetical protein